MTPDHGLFLGIDIGTGSCKAVALDIDRNVVYTCQNFYHSGPDSMQLQNPLHIWTSFLSTLKEITAKANGNIKAISLSACMHSLILVDINNTPLTGVLTWADNRAKDIALKLRESENGKKLYADTGMPVHGMSPLTKIIWFRENDTPLFKNTYKFISIKEFIWFRLFNSYEIDCSIAAATGLFNIHTFKWNESSLQLAGINSSKLADIVQCNHSRIINTEDKELFFVNGIKFIIGSSDGCMANYGSLVLKPGQAAVTIGTSGAVRITSASPVIDYENMTFNYPIDKQTFICGGPINNGGNVALWLLKTFLNIENPGPEDYDHFFKLIEMIPAGSDGLLFLPYLYGERAPVWDEDAMGCFIGIKHNHTKSHFLRAGIEGVCYALNQIINILNSRDEINDIHLSGGFIHAHQWVQILSDITCKKVSVFYEQDASAIGAAILSLITIENMAKEKEAGRKTLNENLPDLDKSELYKKYTKIFSSVYAAVRPVMNQLKNIS